MDRLRPPLPPFEGDDLEPRIAPVVHAFREWGIDTLYSCDGGEGHACSAPTVEFRGDEQQAFQALALVYAMGYRVWALRKVWLFSGLDLHAMPLPTWHLQLCGPPLIPEHAGRIPSEETA